MVKRKLLIADNSEDFLMVLTEALRADYQIRSALDGKEALELLHSFHPDILVMELMLPGLDGISLLHSASAAGIRPMVMVVTCLSTAYAMEAVTRLDVDYVVPKPCDIQAVSDRIHDLAQRLQNSSTASSDPYRQASELLHILGFPTKRDGYAYLREAIVLMAINPEQSLTKELYPAIAVLHSCTQTCVERSIRTAIESAWKDRNEALWLEYFPPKSGNASHRPTNATVITRLAETIQLSR